MHDIEFFPGLECSDHLCIHFSIICTQQRSQSNGCARFHWDWKRANFGKVEKKLEAYKLEEKIRHQNIEAAWPTINEVVNKVINEEIPMAKIGLMAKRTNGSNG